MSGPNLLSENIFRPALGPQKQILSLSHIEEQREASEYCLCFIFGTFVHVYIFPVNPSTTWTKAC